MIQTRDERASEARQDAQRRVDQVSAFTRELAELERAGVLALPPGQREQIERYHGDVLATLARRFDVDQTDEQRQMALGMRVASLLGAVTLSAAVVLFFYRVWGLLTTPAQVISLIAVPLLMLLAVEVAARREPTRYIASVLSLIAAASFALNLSVVGAIFNMTPTPLVLAAWAAFALAVAYTYGLRLLLAGGVIAAMGYGVAAVASATGLDWSVSLVRPEPLLLLGPLAIAASFWPSGVRPEGFARTWRLVGVGALLLPLLFLSTWTEVFSYRLLPLNGTREDFRIRTAPNFDALAPAEAFANHVCDFLFNPERAARLVQYHARYPGNPSLDEVFDSILMRTWKSPMRSTYHTEVQHTVNMVVLNELMSLAANERASNQVRAIAEFKLEELKNWLMVQQRFPGSDQKATLFYAAEQIKRFQSDPKKMNLTKPNDPPDGQPIGTDWWSQANADWECRWN